MLVLVGPTAVGKSAFAFKIAQSLGTDIISADSALVYRHLDIGTAKPSQAEQRRVKHHLIDMVTPDQDFSVADYQKNAYVVIEQLWQQGKLPFMVGGTGLYVKAVTDCYSFGHIGKNSPLREEYELLAKIEGVDKLYARLTDLDP
ncbi:MAG TPA: isopentenyl transferase family protein, partial [Candidatus Limnocylindrales bacterium]|nr:isopentenyl transferase family protein [Candidatus Limnocylindrales bacterium]